MQRPQRILLINPNTSQATTEAMHALALPCLPDGVSLHSVTAAQGVPMITTPQELKTAIVQVATLAEQWIGQADAIVIGAFGNPGLQELQQLLTVPVLGIGQAAMQEAAANGRKFGVATTTPALRSSIDKAVQKLGLQSMYTGCQVPEGEPLLLAQNPSLQDAALAQAVHACIHSDGAQAVVIGGGPLAECVPRLAPRFDVPIISPVEAAIRMAVQALKR